MRCPVDGAELIMTERSGVEIDYCPKCRGVWLDRGELDKIVERAGAPLSVAPEVAAPPAPARPAAEPFEYRPAEVEKDRRRTEARNRRRDWDDDDDDDWDDDRDDDWSDRRPRRRKKKKSAAAELLSELFDF